MDICLVMIPGSPYVMKAMCALESRNVDYDCHWVDLPHISTQLPPPHLVPVMVCNNEVIADSTDILRYIDEHVVAGQEMLFANEDIAAWEDDIDEVLSKYMYFFIFCDSDTWARGMKETISKQTPSFLQMLGYTPEVAAAKHRDDIRARVSELLGTAVGDDDGHVVMDRGVAPLLSKYNLLLDGRRYLHGGVLPSAADCALYGLLERVVGDGETAGGDLRYRSLLPDLLAQYPHLQAFQQAMRADYPMRFKGKRRAGEKTKLPLPGLYAKKPFVPPVVWKHFCVCS